LYLFTNEMLTYTEIEFYTRTKRQDLIMLRIKKKKLLEDRNKDEVFNIDIQYNKVLEDYIYFSKLLIKKKYERTKRIMKEET